MTTVAKLQAWKPAGEGRITPCEIIDEQATEFRLQYIGRAYAEDTIDFKDQLLAETVYRAMHRVFEAGKKQAKAELREWIGGSDATF